MWPCCTSQNPWLQKSAKPCAITMRHPPNDVHNTINSLSVWLLQICMKLFFSESWIPWIPNQMSAPCWLLVSTWTHERGINGAKSLCLDMRCNELWGFGLLLHPVTKQQLEQPGGYHGYPNFRKISFSLFLRFFTFFRFLCWVMDWMDWILWSCLFWCLWMDFPLR